MPLSKKRRVGFIGIGEMGAAIARTVLAAGHEVTVWNRTISKCAALAAAGARVAESIDQTVSAADVVIVCVSDYAALRASLHAPSVSRLLFGKTVVQFTSRTPSEAREGGAWAQRHGIDYLEGAIFCYPPSIGTEEASLVYSGSQSVFAATRDLLQSLGGQVVYVGQAIGSSAALDLGVVGTFVPGAVVSFLQGAALCEAEGASLETYLALVCQHALPTLAVATMKSSVEMIARRDFAYAEGGGAPLDVWMGGLKLAATAIDEAHAGSMLMTAVLQCMQSAIESGHGKDEMGSLFNVFKAKSKLTAAV